MPVFDPATGELFPADGCSRCAAAVSERLQAEVDLQAAERELRRVRRRIRELETQLRNAVDHSEEARLAEIVFKYWCRRCSKGKRARLGDKRKKVVVNRLKDGYSVDYIARAIDGLAVYAFDNGAQRFDDLELVCRNEVNLEKFYMLAERNNVPTEWGQNGRPGPQEA